jgi:galactofuranose transport system ATP-binding protein
MPVERPTGEPLLVMRGISKAFNGVPALQDASFEVTRGEVHALIGQNGAGKSTLIKILTGVYDRDAGEVVYDGRPVRFSGPHDAQLGGIATIYQEVNLVGYRSLAENVFLGREPRRFGLIDWRRMNDEAARILASFGLEVDVTRPLNSFAVATQQLTAIARAISVKAGLVIMDEPTSSLADAEVEVLFGVIRRLKADGVSLVFVSHKLDELYAICDRVTIMRDGRTVHAAPMNDVSRMQLVTTMLGRELAEQLSHRRSAGDADIADAPVVEVEGLRRGTVLGGVDVVVRPGEIVGLAGLLGSGRTETARALFGADPIDAGTIIVKGSPRTMRSPRDAIKSGFGLTPEDRKTEGIVPEMSVRENLTLALLPRLTRHGILDRRRQREIVERFIADLGVKLADADQPIRELSGGNQQKVILARWLCTQPELLILDEPTRGIDVGAKREIQQLVRRLADDGLAVLLISSEVEELVADSDRVVVLRDGRSVAELDGDAIDEQPILQAMATGSAAGADGTGTFGASGGDAAGGGR